MVPDQFISFQPTGTTGQPNIKVNGSPSALLSAAGRDSAATSFARYVCVFLISLSCLLAQSTTTQPSVTLSPAKAFDLRAALASHQAQTTIFVHAFRANPLGLYFLVSPSYNTKQSSIIHTDYRGVYVGTIQLPQTAEAVGFDVDTAGSMAVLISDKTFPNGQAIFTYSPDGTSVNTLPVSKVGLAISLSGGSPVVLSQTTVGADLQRITSSGSSSISRLELQRPATPALLATAPDQRLIVVEKTAAVLHFVDAAGSGSVADFSPRVPEMAWLSQLSPGPSPRNVAFSALATDLTGQVFLLLGHFKLSEGVPVVVFHMNGNLTQTIRCKLPQFPDEKNENNPDGEMAGVTFVGTNGSLLILASGAGKVAVYGL